MQNVAPYIFILFAMIVFAIFFYLELEIGAGSSRAERNAEAAVCSAMASQVLSGEVSRFDYMATRCSAQFLVPAKED